MVYRYIVFGYNMCDSLGGTKDIQFGVDKANELDAHINDEGLTKDICQILDCVTMSTKQFNNYDYDTTKAMIDDMKKYINLFDLFKEVRLDNDNKLGGILRWGKCMGIR